MPTITIEFDLTQGNDAELFRATRTATAILSAITGHFGWLKTQSANEERAAQPFRVWQGFNGAAILEELMGRLDRGSLMWVASEAPVPPLRPRSVTLSFDANEGDVALKATGILAFVRAYIAWMAERPQTLMTWEMVRGDLTTGELGRQLVEAGVSDLIRF